LKTVSLLCGTGSPAIRSNAAAEHKSANPVTA